MANRVIPPHRRDPDDSHDSQYYRRGVDDIRNVITSTTEPLGAEPGTLWYNPEGVPEYGVDIGISKDDADQLYTSKDEFAAVADVPPRVEAVETKVARVDPGEYAGAVGESLAQGPDGPAWRKDAVSADWFSNVNDAITAAGVGGTVVLSQNTTYTTDGDPFTVLPKQTIRGMDPRTSRIHAASGSAIAVRDPSSTCDFVTIRSLTLTGGSSADVGLDARGMTRSLFENIYVQGFPVGVWFGGDNPAYQAGWTNTLNKVEILVPLVGAGIRFKGKTTGGASTPNNIAVRDAAINLADAETSIGIDLQDGDTNIIEHSDVGYGTGLSIPFYLGPKARYNTFLANRSEDVDRSVVIEGGTHNSFIANVLGGSHPSVAPVTISTSGTDHGVYNAFLQNRYSQNAIKPVIAEEGGVGARSTYISDKQQDQVNTFTVRHLASQDYVAASTGHARMRFRLQTDTQDRMHILAGGSVFFGDGATSPDTRWYRRGANLIGTADDDSIQAGDGTWNGGNLRLGNYRLWVDASGSLRMKNGSPTSDTDGTIVGTQGA